MKKLIVLLIAVVSGISLFADILIPDPLPFLDEAILFAIFTKSITYLGFDLTRFMPFLKSRRSKQTPTAKPAPAPADFPSNAGPTIDV